MENYAFFKHLCTENAYTSMTKTLNSIHCTVETRKTIKVITKKDIVMAHMGELVIDKGICYATFLQNPGNDGESNKSETSKIVLSIFRVDRAMADDFDPEVDVDVYPLGGMGDTCAGHTATYTPFKENSMCLVGDLLHICLTFLAEDKRAPILRKTFNIRTREWVGDAETVLRYGECEMDFTTESLRVIYDDLGVKPYESGMMELVSAWSEYEGEYYATGITCGGGCHGFIVKTRDFTTMDFVGVVPFNDNGMAEVSSYIFKNKLYVACRQDYGIPYIYLGALDLRTMKWDVPYKIPDGNCRPWFFEYKDELYLLNTIAEGSRRYTNISRIRTWDHVYSFYNVHHPIEVMATVKDCGRYFATASHEGEIYYVASEGKMCFGKLCLDFLDEDEVNQKLYALFCQSGMKEGAKDDFRPPLWEGMPTVFRGKNSTET